MTQKPDGKSGVTQLLQKVNAGDESAYEPLFQIVYDDLRKMARIQMSRERGGHTLQPTEVVHEAYSRLVGGKPSWENRRHFFGAAARAMRRVLVDYARKRAAEKRGGGQEHITFTDLGIQVNEPDVDLVSLDEALTALAEEHPRLAEAVELRYFTGLSIQEAAEVLDISPATLKRDWTYARAWLYERMSV